MSVIHANFDGSKLETPAALLQADPQQVKIVFVPRGQTKGTHRLVDVMGRLPNPRSDEELDAELRREREAW